MSGNTGIAATVTVITVSIAINILHLGTHKSKLFSLKCRHQNLKIPTPILLGRETLLLEFFGGVLLSVF